MNIEEVRLLFDEQERKQVDFPSMRREVLPEIVRIIGLDQQAQEGSVIYSKLTPENADAMIEREIDYFARIGQNFEWKLYDYDSPSDLRERLIRHGFEQEDEEAFLVLDLQEHPELLNASIPAGIRHITTPDKVRDAMAVLEQVWGEDRSDLQAYLEGDLAHNPDAIRFYIAYVEDRPVSAAWMYLQKQSEFASLWGGSTLPEYRQHGFYTGLLAVRAQEAHRLGKRFLMVDASPMSRPILERRGFHLIGMTYPMKKEKGA